jgi:competence protein ComEC
MPTPFAALVLAALALAPVLAFADAVPTGAVLLAVGALVLALPRRERILGVALLCVQLTHIAVTVHTSEHVSHTLVEAFTMPSSCAIRGIVESAVQRREDAFAWDLRVTGGACPAAQRGVPLAGVTVRVRSADGTMRRGDELAVDGTMVAGATRRAPWEPSRRFAAARGVPVVHLRAERVETVARSNGMFAHIDDARIALREFFQTRLDSTSAALLRALVLAEVDLAPDVTTAYKRSGLSHVLAVSGMHLTLVAGAALHAARALVRRVPKVAAVVPAAVCATIPAAGVATAYAALTGFGGSSLRALAMLAAHAAMTLAGRRPSGASSLAASSLVVGLVDPFAMTDLSTALSISATAALVLAGNAVVARVPGPRAVATAVGASVAATLGTAPVLTAFALPVPLAGIVANVVAVPLGELVALPFALGGSMLALCTHQAFAMVATAFLGVAAAALDLVTRVASIAASCSSLVWFLPQPCPASAAAIVVTGSLVVALRAPRARLVVASVGAFVALVGEGTLRASRPGERLRLTHLDVGQGDATVVEFPDGPLWLVDGGGQVGSSFDVGERTVVPALVQARRAPEVVVLSHPHPDHFGGLYAVLRDRPPRELWDTGQGELEDVGGAYATLLHYAREHGIRVRRPRELCGAHRVGTATVQVLAPCPGPTSDRGPNDNSFVLRIVHGDRTALLTGDAEHALEDELLARVGAAGLRAEVLKVGHHGSRTSSSDAFLAAVAPRVATVSAGLRNRFGHPHPVVLERLATHSVEVLRTDQLGTIREETLESSWSFAPLTFSGGRFDGAW